MTQDRWHEEHWVPVDGLCALKRDDWKGIYGTCVVDVAPKKEGKFMKWLRGSRIAEIEDRLKDWIDAFGTRLGRVESNLKRAEHSLEWLTSERFRRPPASPPVAPPAASLIYIPSAELKRLREEMKQLEWRIRALEEDN